MFSIRLKCCCWLFFLFFWFDLLIIGSCEYLLICCTKCKRSYQTKIAEKKITLTDCRCDTKNYFKKCGFLLTKFKLASFTLIKTLMPFYFIFKIGQSSRFRVCTCNCIACISFIKRSAVCLVISKTASKLETENERKNKINYSK